MLNLKKPSDVICPSQIRPFFTDSVHVNDSLTPIVSSILGSSNSFYAYQAAIFPIMERWDARWSALLSFGDRNSSHASCEFSTDPSLIGTRSSADVAIISLFGSDSNLRMIEGKVVSRLYNCVTTARYTPPLAYLPFMYGNERFLLLLKRGSGDATPVRMGNEWLPTISSIIGCARTMGKLFDSQEDRAELQERYDQLLAIQDDLHFRANHDDLTELPNRSFTKMLVEKRLRGKGAEGRLALAFVDLDDFKHVNDTHGHAIGDALLRSVAARLRSSIRNSDICGRVGGDEFVLCIDGPEGSFRLQKELSRVTDSLRQPFTIENRQIACSASLGAALFPRDGTRFETLLSAADAAMYRAKKTISPSI